MGLIGVVDVLIIAAGVVAGAGVAVSAKRRAWRGYVVGLVALLVIDAVWGLLQLRSQGYSAPSVAAFIGSLASIAVLLLYVLVAELRGVRLVQVMECMSLDRGVLVAIVVLPTALIFLFGGLVLIAVVVLSPGNQPLIINVEVVLLAIASTIGGFLAARFSVNKLSSCIRMARKAKHRNKGD